MEFYDSDAIVFSIKKLLDVMLDAIVMWKLQSFRQ